MHLSLNGNDWLFKDFVGEDWIWRNSEKPDTKDLRWWRPGTVPGSVHHDLLQLKEIPDPYLERNSLLVEWVPARTWIYKKKFTVSEQHQGKYIQLCFKGIDYEAHVFLNGERLGCHKGMFKQAVFNIEDQILFGEENLLAVVLERAPDEEPQVSKSRYVHTHKSRMTYWWDFCPRMIHMGIWDDVYLNMTGSARIENVFVQPTLTDDYTQAHISVSSNIHAHRKMSASLEITIYYKGEEVARHHTKHALSEGSTSMNSCLTIDQPELWWPNGQGKASLYEAKVTIRELIPESRPDASDETVINFGIRNIELVSNETEALAARPYTFVVNGRKVYIKGWNWVPIDVMYSVEQPKKLERLLTLARRANVNMLRVWGGGLIEKDSFYELCSQYGIMVWQEFIQSSSGIENKPSEDPMFIDMMVKEAEHIIPRKRNHPSLAVWCGGNELQDGDGNPLDDREPVLGALAEVVKRLDPHRYWLPTSPTGPFFSNSLQNIEKDPTGLHDVHGPWEHQGLTNQYTLYNKSTSLLHSEFGVEGMTNLRVIHHTINEEHQWPASKDNPVYFHRGSWWNNEPLVQEAFGGIEKLGTLVYASQFLQAEGLRYAVEANMRRQYQNSGTLPWQFNEPFPNAYCTSALDYYAEPKAVYYAISRAYLPIHISARFDTQVWEGRDRFDAEIWAANSSEQGFDTAELTMKIIGASGKIYSNDSELVHVLVNGSSRLTECSTSLAELNEDLFFLDISLKDADGGSLSQNRYLFSRTANLSPMLNIQPAKLTTAVKKNQQVWKITLKNNGDAAALNVRLDEAFKLDEARKTDKTRQFEAAGYVYFDDNYFSLLPGETRTVIAEWSGAAEELREINLAGWNTEVYRID